MFLLSTGGRISETLSLKKGCIVEALDGIPLSTGRRYKLVWRDGGAERDWPLPDVAIRAIKQQELLVDLIRQWNATVM